MGTGDLGVIIESESGSVLIVNHSTGSILSRVEGLGIFLMHHSCIPGMSAMPMCSAVMAD